MGTRLGEERAGVRAELGEVAYERSRFPDARALLEEVGLSTEYVDFLALPGYQRLVNESAGP